jgi:deazaflavin-dependent oxidoreductase (nitroreductase family)
LLARIRPYPGETYQVGWGEGRQAQSPTWHAGDVAHYRKPGWFTRHIFNPGVALCTRLGLSIWGSRVLRVKGRKSGEWRSVPVNLLTLEGTRYLVSPRGETQWVRNLRAAGTGELVLGRKTERFEAVEVEDEEKPGILRAYLKRWKMEVGVFFDGVSADSSDTELRRIAPKHPVFRIQPISAG